MKIVSRDLSYHIYCITPSNEPINCKEGVELRQSVYNPIKAIHSPNRISSEININFPLQFFDDAIITPKLTTALGFQAAPGLLERNIVGLCVQVRVSRRTARCRCRCSGGGLWRFIKSKHLPSVADVDFLFLVPRPDSKWGQCLFDIKTTDDASIDRWARTVLNYRYYYQAALYLDVINAATGCEYQRFGNIVQESAAPFEIGRRMISDTYIEIGRAEYKKDLANYCRCLKANSWPGYDDWDEDNTDSPVIGGFRYVDAPTWFVKQSPIMQ